MKNELVMNRWLPRILTILFAMFVGMFALDVFGEGKSFWPMMLEFVIHLIPMGIVVAVLVASWRREWIGASIFVVIGLWYMIETLGRFRWTVYLIISGP